MNAAVLHSALRRVLLFDGLDEAELAWLAKVGEPRRLVPGEILFREGQPAVHFYVLLDGELVVTKVMDGREEELTRHSSDPSSARPEPGKPPAAHCVTGEIPLLSGTAHAATVRAEGPVRVVGYSGEVFAEMLERCNGVARRLLPVLAWRLKSVEAQARDHAAAAALDTLAAALAHELNNPVSVVDRAARELADIVELLVETAWSWGEVASPAEHASVSAMIRLLVAAEPDDALPVDALTMADIEDELADWAEAAGARHPGLLATVMAERGLLLADLRGHTAGLGPHVLPAALDHLAAVLEARTTAAELSQAGLRIAALVAATRDYSRRDRGPRRAVSVVESLESTLTLLRTKLGPVSVVREYQPELPRLSGYPSELGQVWTNLIDNAVDAMAGRGTLTLRAGHEADTLVVEVIDSGPGIAADVLPRVFEPFFTTKDVGRGRGLGLHLAHQIVTQRHKGTITARSVPGETRIEVRLPVTADP
ncbi:signal transduction histidine kinase [Streptacidiphilus sp. MAP12-20]|uniref:ATP-binding protein n=1 Tax=Streptacidiphilus sp. MAP12-20 TaxID=3156299 RepID=UPI003516F408